MKTIEFKPSGVLWRLATFYGPYDEYTLLRYGADVCSFTRAVLKGLFKVLLILIGCAIGAALVGDTLGWLAAMLVQWVFIQPNEAASIVASLVAVVSVVALAVGTFLGARLGYEKYQERNRPSCLYKPPSQLRVMYNSWKEKYCVQVTFKSQD